MIRLATPITSPLWLDYNNLASIRYTSSFQTAEWKPHVDAGKLRLLLLLEKSKQYPNAPTFQDLGYGNHSSAAVAYVAVGVCWLVAVETLLAGVPVHDLLRGVVDPSTVGVILWWPVQVVQYVGAAALLPR